jgi:hypothetical protein
MNPRIPEPVQPLLSDFLALVQRQLPDFFSAFYLYGGSAHGAFNVRLSDIDFIAVLSRRATQADLERLRLIHEQIATQYPQWEMDGIYLQWSDLGKITDIATPYPRYADRKLTNDHQEGNSVTWWELKNKGIVLLGPEPRDLDFTVDWELLITRMHQNLNTYWVQFTRKPVRIAWLFSDYGIQWTALGVLRQYYTFREQNIVSKTEAGRYGLTHLPPRWHRLISEAIHIREQGCGYYYRSRILRAVEAFRYIRMIIQFCNESS